jgi:hypothetical protein
MFLTMYFLMALSFGTRAAEFSQRTNLTCPRPFLFRPLFRRFLVILMSNPNSETFELVELLGEMWAVISGSRGILLFFAFYSFIFFLVFGKCHRDKTIFVYL